MSTDFAALGLEGTTKDGFSVRYEAGTDLYVIDLPSKQPGGFYEYTSNSPNSRYWGGAIADPSTPGVFQHGDIAVFKPSPTNPVIKLSYTSFAIYTVAGPMEDRPLGYVAFGLSTPGGSVPITGSASYDAILAGAALDSGLSVTGTAALQFDFAAGTLSGNMHPVMSDGWDYSIDLGQYSFTQTVFGVGSTTFSGKLSHSGTSSLGWFEGQFTGPNAQELMARWTAPYQIPGSQAWNDMIGVMVGKKH